MFSMKSIQVAVAICIAALQLPTSSANPFFVNDDRVRDLGVTPVLGRGFSLMTNTFLATCMESTETTTPSYNYDLSHFDFTRTTNWDQLLSGELSQMFAYPFIKNLINDLNQIPAKDKANKPRTYFFITSMRVERFYSSVSEDSSKLTEDALTLLTKQDYVGFFQSCGPNYVRSIRRAQEVTAVFKFDSFRQGLAQTFAQLLRTSGNGSKNISKKLSKSMFNPILDSLEMTIKGYGLSLNQSGAGSLVPTSIDDYYEIMKFAYNVMTQSTDTRTDSGMVYALEAVPWVDNVAFQVASKIQEEDVDIILPRSLMERSFHSTAADLNTWDSNWNNPHVKVADNTTFVRDEWECTKDGYKVDKYGYCCELASMYNSTSRKYGDISTSNENSLRIKLSQRICRPSRSLDKSVVKNNMSTNGEFVTRLDTALRLKLNQISLLEKCVSYVKAIPEEKNYNILKPNESSIFDAGLEFNFTVKHLKLALDPLSNDEFVKHMGKELFEYQEMYYRNCISKMYGGGSSDVEATLFMASTWQQHERCEQHSCLQANMRWDRNKPGKCVGSMINGKDSPFYPDGGDGTCALNGELSGDKEYCKYSAGSLSTFHIKATQCWKNTLPHRTIFYFMELFCDPKVTTQVLSDDAREALAADAVEFCG